VGLVGSTAKVFTQYLARYAEPEARLWLDWLERPGQYHRTWRWTLVIPTFRERVSFLDGLRVACAETPGGLLIVIVNSPKGSGDAVVAEQVELLHALRARCDGVVNVDAGGSLWLGELRDPSGIGVLVVDRARAPDWLEQKQGVGLARKLGSDLALSAWCAGRVSEPWLYQSDADAELPRDYFARRPGPASGAKPGALVFPFRHVDSGDAALARATFQVEARQRYHVLGLRWAGSPYAWHTIGSCIAVHPEAYAKVRGFPKRAAGEDYYLLEKVSKLASVLSLSGAPLLLRARRSDRVPFGTGTAALRLLRDPKLMLDDPACFALLRTWLRRLQRFAAAQDPDLLRPSLVVEDDGGELIAAQLEELGAITALGQLAGETRSAADLLARSHGWFDGLKTLRFLHGVRDRRHSPIAAVRALQTAPFTRLRHGEPSARERSWGNSRALTAECKDETAASTAWREICEWLAQLEQHGGDTSSAFTGAGA
jgi:hypothetical protein